MGRSRAPGGGAAPGDSAAERGDGRARWEESTARRSAGPGAVSQPSATQGCATTLPGAPYPTGHRTPAQTAAAGARGPPLPRPAAGSAMGAAPGPGPAPPRPIQSRAPARDPGVMGVPPTAAGLAILGGRGPGEVSSAPLNLSPICLSGESSPYRAGWRVGLAPHRNSEVLNAESFIALWALELSCSGLRKVAPELQHPCTLASTRLQLSSQKRGATC